MGIILYYKKGIISIKTKCDKVEKSDSKKTKKLHYDLTENYFKEISKNKMGYYDAKNVQKLKHTSQQYKIWQICISFLDSILKTNKKIEKIADIGCGIGDFTIDIANRYSNFNKIVGVDFLDEVIDLAEKNEKKYKKVTFVKENLLDLSFQDRSFDITLCINVIHHIYSKDLNKAINELARITDKYLIIEIRNKKNIFNFWYKYFSLPILYKKLPVYSSSIDELNKILNKEKFELKRVKGIYANTRICWRLLLMYKKV